jgi:hypothetical protein
VSLRRRWNNFKALPTKWAYRTLCRAMRRDPSYAHSWFCNIAMPIYDEVNRGCVEPILSGKQAGVIADKIMRHLFGVENSETSTGKAVPRE